MRDTILRILNAIALAPHYVAAGVAHGWRGFGTARHYARLIVRHWAFKLSLIFVLVFGTYNESGPSVYRSVNKHLVRFIAGWDTNTMITVGVAVLVALAVWLLFNRRTNRVAEVLWVVAVVCAAVAAIYHYDLDWVELVWVGFILAVTAAFWVFLIRFSAQMMGHWIFILATLAIASGIAIFYARLHSWVGVAVNQSNVIFTAQLGMALLLMAGIVFPLFRRWLTSVASVYTPERAVGVAHEGGGAEKSGHAIEHGGNHGHDHGDTGHGDVSTKI